MIGPLPHPLNTRTLPTAEIWKEPSRPGPPAVQPPRPPTFGLRARDPQATVLPLGFSEQT